VPPKRFFGQDLGLIRGPKWDRERGVNGWNEKNLDLARGEAEAIFGSRDRAKSLRGVQMERRRRRSETPPTPTKPRPSIAIEAGSGAAVTVTKPLILPAPADPS
jgi:hypothetical protein